MLNYITGRSGTGKSTAVVELIKKAIAETDRDVVLIVPEQQTVVWETRIAEALPESAYLRLEITNFTRLANSVFREFGGLADSVVDEGSRMLIVWRAMLSVWGGMTVYNKTAGGREDRNISHLLRALDELKGSGITPADAEAALDRLEDENDSSLTARLRDAVLVYAAYNTLLHEEYIDRGDLLDNLAVTLRNHPYFKGKSVFIDSFFSLTRAEERILEQIVRQAEDLTVTFACPAMPSDDELQFAEVREFYKTALRIAARAGRDVNRISLDTDRRHKPDSALSVIERYLFDYGNGHSLPDPSSLPDIDNVEILRCADRFDEAEACAALIDRLLLEGYRCGDIAVVARDIKKSEGIVDAALRAHGIRCFISEPGSVSSSPAVRLILSALGVQASGWMRRDILRMIKTGLTPLDEYESDVFELYTETWNIRGKRMYAGEDGWSMNPDGYKTERTPRAEIMLEIANRARAKLIPPLEKFLSVFESDGKNTPADVRAICEAIVYFAEDIGLEAALERTADEYRARGMAAEAEKIAAGWQAVCEILDRMVTMLDGVTLDAGRFSGLFQRVASSMDVGTIPTGIDEVVLGSAAGVRFDEVKCVILLGSVEGEFPGNPTDDGTFFSEGDRVRLETIGLDIATPDLKLRTAREYFMYYRTAAAATEKLFILAPVTGDAALSEGASRIAALLGDGRVNTFGAKPLSEVLYHPAAAEYLLSRRHTAGAEHDFLERLAGETETGLHDVPLTAANDVVRLSDSDPDGSPETAESPEEPVENSADFKKRRISLTQSRIEKFINCPFLYWCQYKMRLQSDPKAEISTPDVGIFVHEILEKFFRDLPPGTDLTAMTRRETEERADRAIGDYIRRLARQSGMWDLIRLQTEENDDASPPSDELKKIVPEGIRMDARLEYLFIRLRRSVLVFLEAILREIAQSGFTPAAFELPIGVSKPEDAQRAVTPVKFVTEDGYEVVLRGIADRVDIYKAEDGRSYVRVVDYKTGSKTFSLDDVKQGIGIQLLIYLFSVWKSGIPGIAGPGELLPAGASYFSAKPGSGQSENWLTADEARELVIKTIGRSGIFLADEEVLDAMDRGLSGNYIPVKKNSKSGEIRSTAALATLEEFGQLYRELSDTVSGIAAEITSGIAHAAPKMRGGRLPCEYCSNKMVCRV
jgi:ATP-dependent helicase/nuclease subunit B